MPRYFQIKFGIRPLKGIYSVSFEEKEKIDTENHEVEYQTPDKGEFQFVFFGQSHVLFVHYF
jgi:hypothetical protein